MTNLETLKAARDLVANAPWRIPVYKYQFKIELGHYEYGEKVTADMFYATVESANRQDALVGITQTCLPRVSNYTWITFTLEQVDPTSR